jgi:hypothetical protein
MWWVFSVLRMEAADSSETFVNIYQTIWRHTKSVPCFRAVETGFLNIVSDELQTPNSQLVSVTSVRNVAVVGVAILFRIAETLGSNLGPKSCSGKCSGRLTGHMLGLQLRAGPWSPVCTSCPTHCSSPATRRPTAWVTMTHRQLY